MLAVQHVCVYVMLMLEDVKDLFRLILLAVHYGDIMVAGGEESRSSFLLSKYAGV